MARLADHPYIVSVITAGVTARRRPPVPGDALLPAARPRHAGAVQPDGASSTRSAPASSSPAPSRPPTAPASCTATSSPATCWSRPTTSRRSPTSASPATSTTSPARATSASPTRGRRPRCSTAGPTARSPPTSTPWAPRSGTCSSAGRRSRSPPATTPPGPSARGSCTPLPRPPSAPTCRRRSTGCSSSAWPRTPPTGRRPRSSWRARLQRIEAAAGFRARRSPSRATVPTPRCGARRPETDDDHTVMKAVTVISASGPRRVAPAQDDPETAPRSGVIWAVVWAASLVALGRAVAGLAAARGRRAATTPDHRPRPARRPLRPHPRRARPGPRPSRHAAPRRVWSSAGTPGPARGRRPVVWQAVETDEFRRTGKRRPGPDARRGVPRGARVRDGDDSPGARVRALTGRAPAGRPAVQAVSRRWRSVVVPVAARAGGGVLLRLGHPARGPQRDDRGHDQGADDDDQREPDRDLRGPRRCARHR